MIFKLLSLIILSNVYAEDFKVFCESSLKSMNTFSLAANLKFDETSNAVRTEAVISFNESLNLSYYLPFSLPNKNVVVVESRGFFRSVKSLGGYDHVLLAPISSKQSILSLDLKINISKPNRSTIEFEDGTKFYSNCSQL